MSIFNRQRLTNVTFKLDIERMQRGWYSDKYFENIIAMLEGVAATPDWSVPRYARDVGRPLDQVKLGDIEVEVQFFTRRPGTTIVVGVDKALAMLRHCTGYFDGGRFAETWHKLEVEAVHDGVTVHYDGNPARVQPVIKVRGRYRDFALLETPMLGILGRASRIATNVYQVLVAARGKPVLFFPARFDVHEVQAADGYAYDIAVQRYALDRGEQPGSFVSTDAQGEWWGGHGGGTVAHAAIACFLGDISSAMLAFARFRPAEIPRIALVDFENDSVSELAAHAQSHVRRIPAIEGRGRRATSAQVRPLRSATGHRRQCAGRQRAATGGPQAGPGCGAAAGLHRTRSVGQRLAGLGLAGRLGEAGASVLPRRPHRCHRRVQPGQDRAL